MYHVLLNVEICHSTCWAAVERCWTEYSLSLFLSTSCRLLNDVHQSFSSLVSRGLVERSNMATETAEWNYENVLIWVYRPTRLRNTWFLSSAKRVQYAPKEVLFFSRSRVHVFWFFRLLFFRRFIITATTLAAQSEPKCAHNAQHRLNEYSASRNNLLTSPTLVQQMLSNKCWTVYHWLNTFL